MNKHNKYKSKRYNDIVRDKGDNSKPGSRWKVQGNNTYIWMKKMGKKCFVVLKESYENLDIDLPK